MRASCDLARYALQRLAAIKATDDQERFTPQISTALTALKEWFDSAHPDRSNKHIGRFHVGD